MIHSEGINNTQNNRIMQEITVTKVEKYFPINLHILSIVTNIIKYNY